MATNVTEKEARQVAEAAREARVEAPELRQGALPRQPPARPDPPAAQARPRTRSRRARSSSPSCASFLEREVDPLEIEREAKIPDNVIDGLKRIGAHGHEGARAVRRPRPLAGLLQPRARARRLLRTRRSRRCCRAHQSIGVAAAADGLRLRGAEAASGCRRSPRTTSRAFLLTEPDVGSDPARLGTTAVPTEDGSGYRINGRKLWATNGAIADIVVVMAKVPKSEGRRGGITRVRPPLRRPRA